MPKRPIIKLYIADDEGHLDYEDKSRCIPLWENESKEGKKYLAGKTPNGKKIIGFYQEDD